MEKIEVWGYRCKRCGHVWLPRGQHRGQYKEDATEGEPELPRVCPKCKSPYWNVPRRAERQRGEAQ
jgi:hypothetical protein